MARAIVGGLVFSTVVTLLVLPVVYALLDDLRKHAGRVLRASVAGPDGEARLAAEPAAS
jgi:HAE1 family hydrophobic/amphiphilic exporter-1